MTLPPLLLTSKITTIQCPKAQEHIYEKWQRTDGDADILLKKPAHFPLPMCA